MKYIVVKDAMAQEDIFLFSSTIEHKDMLMRIVRLADNLEQAKTFLVSAGNIFFDAWKDEPTIMYCMGESITLGVSSRGDEDTALLMATLNAG
jgi:hypothetical protein